VELEDKDQKSVFKELAALSEVFGENICGKCNSINLRYMVRVVDDNEFYEIRCLDCGSVLAFGSHKKGNTLFPKRKDTEGKYLENKGWVKWVPPTN